VSYARTTRSTVQVRVRNPNKARRYSHRPPRRAAGTWRVSCSATGPRTRRPGSGRTLFLAASASLVSSSILVASRAICICVADCSSLSRFNSTSLSNNDRIFADHAAVTISSAINSTFELGNEGMIIAGAIVVCAPDNDGIIISSRSVFRAGRQSRLARRNNYPRIRFDVCIRPNAPVAK